MTSPSSQDDQTKSFFGWLLFLVMSALAVIGAFLVINASDDGDSDSTPDAAVEPAAVDPVDLAAIQVALTAAGVEDAGVALLDSGAIELSGTVADSSLRAVAIDAARTAAIGRVQLLPSFDLAPPPAPPVEAAPPAPAFATIDELAADLGIPSGDYALGEDGVLYVRQGVNDTSAFGEFFDIDVVEVSADERRRAALAILQARGVVGANASITRIEPIGLRLDGEVSEGTDIAAIVAEVRALPFVSAIHNQLMPPPPPLDPIVTFTVDRGVVVLTGTVADQASSDAVVAEAGRLFGAGNVVDELVVGEVGPGSLRLVGQVPDRLQGEVSSGLAALAETLGLELEDGFDYTVLEGDDAALQDELVELTDGVQINFAPGSALLPAVGIEQLDTLVEVLDAAPDGIVVAVEGHTDSQGGADLNQRLSENRAQAVVDYLVAQGVDEAKLRAVGNGESQPIADNESVEGRAANRRIEFNVVV